VLITTTYVSLTLLSIVDSNSNAHSKVPSSTWDQAIAMAKSFVSQLNLTEKCAMTSGVGGPCVGNEVLESTAFAVGIHIAATWDRDLFYKRAAAIGKEFHNKGIHFALGPMTNIDRNARHGRNWEGFGADPYLSGENAFFYIQAVQDQGVVATAKHYICNEQETHRIADA
jgi:beta-glucosidase